MNAILEKAAAAVLARNSEELNWTASRMMDRIRGGDSVLTEPFFLVVEAMPYASDCVRAYHRYARCPEVRRWAASSATARQLQQKAVAGLITKAAALSDDYERVSAYQHAATYSLPGSVLEQRSIAGFARYVEALPDKYERLDAYQEAASGAAAFAEVGNSLEPYAVEAFVREVDALPNESERVQLYRYAADRSAPQTLLKRQSIAKIKELTQEDRSPTKSEIAEFVDRFIKPALG